MKKLMIAMASCAILAAQGDVFRDAVIWYRGAVDANGDGVFANGKGCLRNVLRAADSSHYTHGSTLLNASGGPVYIRKMDVHCPYRNEILKDVPCLYFAQEVVEEYDPVVIGGVSRKVQKIRTNSLNLPDLLTEWANVRGSYPCRDYTVVMRFRRDQPVNVNNAGICNMMKLGQRWNTADDSGLWLLMDGNSDSFERWFTHYAGQASATDLGLGNRTYQEFPKRVSSLKIGEGQWVDFALSVKNGNDVTVAYAWDVAGEATSMTNRLVRWWQTTTTYGAGLDARAAYRAYTLGGYDAGSYTAGTVITNGYRTTGRDCLSCEKVMRGAIHQLAFWTNCLTRAEILEAFSNGRPSAFKVGIKGKASQIFTRKSTAVHADDMWEELDTTLTAANPSATVNFTYHHDEEKLVPQVLRLSSESGSGTVNVTVNGRLVVQTEGVSVPVSAGASAHAYIPARYFTTGTNSVTVTRTDAGTTPLVLDELELCGGWQMGRSMADFSHEDYSTNVVGLVTGSWTHYKRGFLTGPGNERNASMYIPHVVTADMAGLYDGRLTLDLAGVALNDKNAGFPFVVTMDGETIWSSDDISGLAAVNVTIPAARFTAGTHEFGFLATAPNAGSWALVDFWRFAYRKNGGIVVVFR